MFCGAGPVLAKNSTCTFFYILSVNVGELAELDEGKRLFTGECWTVCNSLKARFERWGQGRSYLLAYFQLNKLVGEKTMLFVKVGCCQISNNL